MKTRLVSSRLTSSSVALVAVLACAGPGGPAAAQPESSAAAVQSAATSPAFPDFDGDAVADLAYGVGSAPGRVVVAYGSGTSVGFDRAGAGGSPASSDSTTGFGQGLLARDLNRDGYTDLVVVDQSQGGDGSAVLLVFGSPSGLQPSAARTLPAPIGLNGFLGTPALVEDPSMLLVVRVAAPSTVASGGGLLVFPLGADGLPSGEPSILSQRNLPGADRVGDGFGTSLAASGSLLLVGVPGKEVGRAKDAGAVTVLRYRGGTSFSGTVLSQSSKGVPDKAEQGDRFGTALAVGDGYAAVGVPFEDGTRRDSGAVNTFRVASGTLRPMAALTQASSGVPGVSEAGDRFGSSLAVIRACPGVPGFLVGAPNEIIGSTTQAGSAWVVPIGRSCQARQLAEGGRLGGAATEMALIGSAVSAMRTGNSAADTIVITAPGVSEEGVLGRVLTVPYPYSGGVSTAAERLQLHEEGTIALSPASG